MGPKYCLNDGTNPHAWVCDVDWEMCAQKGYDKGEDCNWCYEYFVKEHIPDPKQGPINQFTKDDCDLLTGWYMDARRICRCAEKQYDEYYDYEYYQSMDNFG